MEDIVGDDGCWDLVWLVTVKVMTVGCRGGREGVLHENHEKCVIFESILNIPEKSGYDR